MKTKNLQWVLAAASVIAISACGGGGGGGGGGSFPVGGGGTGTTTGSTLPSSATANVDAFIAYLKQLVATMSDSNEPLDLGSAVAPVSDAAEPAAL